MASRFKTERRGDETGGEVGDDRTGSEDAREERQGKTDGQTTVYGQEGQSDRDRREQEGSQEGRTRPRASQENRVTE